MLLSPATALAAAFDCLIEPAQTVELASPVTGLLDRVHVSRGERIRKGQILVQLESTAEQAAAELARFKSNQTGPTLMAQGKRDFSLRKFERRRDMAAENLMSIQERDDAEAEFKLAEAELAVAKENREIAQLEYRQQSSLLGLRTLRSPFDGVVAEQIAYPGEVVEPSGTKKGILKIAQLDPVRVQVILPKDVFGRINSAMSAEVIPEIPTKGRHIARVKTIDRLVDAASGTFVVVLEMSNPKLDIPAGVKCKANFAGLDAASRRDSTSVKK
jgi:RND family efflux transporter MFP subunit